MLPKNGRSGISIRAESENRPTMRARSSGTTRERDAPGKSSGRKPLRGPKTLHATGRSTSTASIRTSSTSPGSAPST